ncbi:metallophosphoesterase [Deinococcus sp.]|uniref:metallophosphoesterase n=1 Tax=Deinococcus sp. TaxID=47478 RepID=UPI003C79990F
MSDLWVVGDVHGALPSLRTLLQRARLADFEDNWLGDGSTLVLLGDLMDRGPDGLGVVRLVRRLEEQARQVGGQVVSLLGNHEVMLLAALRFRGRRQFGGDPYGLFDYWKQNGGRLRDLSMLEPDDLEWLEARPPMYRHADWLLCHADSRLYLTLGDSLERVSELCAAFLRASTPETWVDFLNAFAERELYGGESGEERAAQMLRVFGGERLAHGHTPVFVLQGTPPSAVMSPYRYAGGLVLGLDSAMAYQKGAGFLVRLEADPGRLSSPDAQGVLEIFSLTESHLGALPLPELRH